MIVDTKHMWSQVKARVAFAWKISHDKWTVWLGGAISGAGYLQAQWPDIINGLPSWAWMLKAEKWSLVILGVLVAVGRVRRLWKEFGAAVEAGGQQS